MASSGSTIEHVGEWKVELFADSREQLFVEVARVIARAAGPASPGPGEWQEVTIDAQDPVALFIDWANELVGRSEIARRAYDEVRKLTITTDDGETPSMRLACEVRGRPVAKWRSPIKAATYHDAVVERAGDRWRAVVLFDV